MPPDLNAEHRGREFTAKLQRLTNLHLHHRNAMFIVLFHGPRPLAADSAQTKSISMDFPTRQRYFALRRVRRRVGGMIPFSGTSRSILSVSLCWGLS